MSSSKMVSEKLPGIQLALLELIWPTFDWIEAIYVTSDSSKCTVHVQAARLLPQDEQDDCERLRGEIFDAVLAGTTLHLR